ncbi:MAG: PAS domain S-box protein [Spirosomataceae bacterium]
MTPVKSREELEAENAYLLQRVDYLSQNQSIHQLQDLVDNTSEMILLLTPEGKFLYVNRAFQEIMGFSEAELSALSFWDIVHPQNSEKTKISLERVATGVHFHDLEIIVKNKDGKRVYLSGDVNCRFENEQPVAFRCLFRDISQRHRAEKAQNLYYSIAQTNLSSKDLNEFLHQVHLELQKNLYANNFFVAVYEPEEGTIYFPYHVDEHYETEENYMRRKMGNGIEEYSIVQNKPLFLTKSDIQSLVENQRVFLYGNVLPEIMVCAPLMVNGKTTGVIGIKSYSDANKFSNRDLELLEFVSGQVALALLRKQNEADLMRQTARLNAVFDSSSHIIWTANKKKLLSSFNKNYEAIIYQKLGFNPKINSSLEKVGWKLIAPEDRPILREKYNLALAGQPQYFEMNWGELDGGNEWYEFYLNPILSSESGEIEEVSGIARNVTTQKKALLSLQKSEEKFRNIIESFIDIYYRTDLAGNITMISPSVLTHTGYSVQEVMGNKVDKFFDNAVDSSKDIKSLLKSGSITNFEVNVKRKNGELRQFMLNIRMIKDAKGIPLEVEGVARDISELKKNAEDLIVAKEQAEHSLKVKERFLANMSHEIRTPMNGIIGMIDVLNETPLESKQKEYVETIKKSSETLLTILNDILDLSKIEAGKMELHLAPFILTEMLDRLVTLFRQRAQEKGNELAYWVADDVPPYWVGDSTRLLQIFSNLTSNALKFTEYGSVRIDVRKVAQKGKKATIKVEVIDTGIGISPQNQALLFASFQQVDNSTKKSFGGTGLGLAISRELCRQMNGDMGVISEEGKGSCFWFTLEIKTTTIVPISENIHTKEVKFSEYFIDYQPRILLVDDNMINRKVASEILLKANCLVTTAESGQQAIQKVGQDATFDLILMDIQMPEMDGIETTQRLREIHGKKLPTVVAMTAYSMQHDRERFLSLGMDDYIPKPIRAQSLLQKVREIMLGTREKQAQQAEIDASTITDKEITSLPYTLPDTIEAFDMEVVKGLFEMVGEETLVSVYEDFITEATEQIQTTKEAYKLGDVVQIQRELHTLKGNSGTIGLMRIHEVTKDIEVPAKEGNLMDFEAKITVLEYEFNQFMQTYQAVIEQVKS